MGQVINLRRARKARARSERGAQATGNAARHGLSKAQRCRIEADADKARHDLDAHALDRSASDTSDE